LEYAEDNAAIDFFLHALRLDENYWIAAMGCADAYANLKDWAKSLHYHKQALKSDIASEFPGLWFNRAIVEGKLKLYEDEVRSFRKCLELDPDYPAATNNLGWALVKAGNSEEAVPVLQRAVEEGKMVNIRCGTWRKPFGDLVDMKRR
jgi:tetratricopeptide (TPR) repeat protein